MTWRSFHAPENARVSGFQDDGRCDGIEETENSLAGVWDTEAFLYAFEVETPQIISRAAHALPDGKCFSRGNPLGLLYEPVPDQCSVPSGAAAAPVPRRSRARARARVASLTWPI